MLLNVKFGYAELHVFTLVFVVPIEITLFEKSPAIKMLLPFPKKNLLLNPEGMVTVVPSARVYDGGATLAPKITLLFPDAGLTDPLPMIMLLEPTLLDREPIMMLLDPPLLFEVPIKMFHELLVTEVEFPPILIELLVFLTLTEFDAPMNMQFVLDVFENPAKYPAKNEFEIF
jgi:hypothetical protein